MEDLIKGQVEQKSLINDQYYFKYIFKKTEKIVSAVFFVLSKVQNITADNVVRADLERRAKDAHSVALSLLNMEPTAASYGMQTLVHSLVSLDSVLRIFSAMGGISTQNLEVITAEIESVQRGMRRYLGEDAFSVLDQQTTHVSDRLRASDSRTGTERRAAEPAATPLRSPATAGNRSEQILSVLKVSDGIGIKDFSAVITDCSEKTIQRELLSLIEKGLIRKEGERRWSRYFLS